MNAAVQRPLHSGGHDGGGGVAFQAAFILGIALGGFLDGILLHQLLQWHHLLSGLEGEAWRDIRVQILADGAFHILMYAIAVIGLFMLLRNRHDAALRSGRRLTAGVLLGIGVWNIADIALFHWILGIHRIRMDVENLLFWDLLWFAVFGLGIGGLGLWLWSRPDTGPGHGGRRPIPAMMLAGLVTATGIAASLPMQESEGDDRRAPLLVWFLPGTSPADIFAAVNAVAGRTIWSDSSGQVYLIDAPAAARSWQLYRYGALPISSNVSPAACFRAMRLT